VFDYNRIMDPTTAPETVGHPLLAAVDAAETAVEHLIKLVDDGSHTDLGAFGLVEVLRHLERVRNKLPVVDGTLIQHGSEQGAPGTLSERSMVGVLMSGLRISAGEASRRVRAAEHLAERHSQLGEPLPPIRGHLARAQRDGLVTPEQVALIDGALRKVGHCAPADVDAGEVLVTEQANRLGFKDLQTVVTKVVEAIDPDGTLPADEAEHEHRRFLHLKQRTDGSWVGDFRFTPAVGAKLAALLGPLMQPRTTTVRPDTTDGTPGKKLVLDDDRTVGQRRHDAFAEILDACLRSGERPETQSGTPATLILTFTWAEFTQANGIGSYADGTPCSARAARDLVGEADIAFCVKGAKGQPLDLYRTKRIASTSQTLALIARDGGCSFPGCQVAPQFCERHHVISWWDGGDTNIANLTLLCSYHHHRFAHRGWQCVITTDGLPVWIPPRWIDPQQRPILNHRILISNWDVQDPLNFDPPDLLAHTEAPDPPSARSA
jgi:hypothetical protein